MSDLNALYLQGRLTKNASLNTLSIGSKQRLFRQLDE